MLQKHPVAAAAADVLCQVWLQTTYPMLCDRLTYMPTSHPIPIYTFESNRHFQRITIDVFRNLPVDARHIVIILRKFKKKADKI